MKTTYYPGSLSIDYIQKDEELEGRSWEQYRRRALLWIAQDAQAQWERDQKLKRMTKKQIKQMESDMEACQKARTKTNQNK